MTQPPSGQDHHGQPQQGYQPPGYPPQGYHPQGYPPPGYGYPPHPGTNGLAIASLVLGILWIYWVGSILALVFGYVARNQIKASGQTGAGMAVAGIVLGWVGVGTLALLMMGALSVGLFDTGY